MKNDTDATNMGYLPNTPYFKARGSELAAGVRHDLDALSSDGIGYLKINGIYMVNQYYNYGLLLGDAVSVSFAWLSRRTRATVGEVKRNMLAMRELGLFSEHVIDEDARVMYFTESARNHAFVEYDLDEDYKEVVRRRTPEIKASPPPGREQVTDKTPKEDARGFAAIVRGFNDALPDPDITRALDETERLVVMLSDTVRNMPAQNKKLDDITGKYLPQLKSLLQAYERIYRAQAAGTRAEKIKTDITDAVQMFNKALRQLTEDLLSDTELEITAEITRLKMMLERDGLIAGAFQLKT